MEDEDHNELALGHDKSLAVSPPFIFMKRKYCHNSSLYSQQNDFLSSPHSLNCLLSSFKMNFDEIPEAKLSEAITNYNLTVKESYKARRS